MRAVSFIPTLSAVVCAHMQVCAPCAPFDPKCIPCRNGALHRAFLHSMHVYTAFLHSILHMVHFTLQASRRSHHGAPGGAYTTFMADWCTPATSFLVTTPSTMATRSAIR